MMITMRELLNHFNLDVDLPEYLYSESFYEGLKEADLEIDDDVYKFKYGNTLLTVSPNEEEVVKLENTSERFKSGEIYTKDQIVLY